MTNLTLDAELYMNREDRARSRHICEGVVEGLWPWVPENIDLMMDFDIDFNRYRLCARARGAFTPTGRWDFAYTVPLDRDDLIDDPDGWSITAHNEFVKAFRNRQDWPLPDNIILGEN